MGIPLDFSALYGILLGVSALCALPLLWARLREYSTLRRAWKKYTQTEDDVPDRAPAISVVVLTRDQAATLEANLPAILEQQYPFFEVIVVYDIAEDDTSDVMKRLEAKYTRLRHTFIPSTTRFISYEKLAVTLGIKAAKHDWVFLTRADCRPASDVWLMGFSHKLTSDKDLAIGYANYVDDGSWRVRAAIFRRLRRNFFNFSAALSGRAVGGDGCNMAVRKSRFMAMQGYTSQLTYTCGEDSLLVDRLAEKGNTAVICSADTTVLQAVPTRQQLKTVEMSQAEALRHLSRRGKRLRMGRALVSWCAYGHYVALWCALAARLLSLWPFAAYNVQEIWMDGAWLILLGLMPVSETFVLRKSTRAVGERDFGPQIAVYDVTAPLRRAYIKWCRWRHRKDFRRRW